MPEEYIVVIKKTKVGDPTAIFQFSINNTPMDNLGIKLKITDNDTGRNKVVIDTVISVPNANDVILMEPFSSEVQRPTGQVSAQVTFSGGDYSLGAGGIDSQYSPTAGDSSFVDDNIDLVSDENLPDFTPPSQGQSILVAIQCIDDAGNKAFLGQRGSDMYATPLFNNLDIYLTWRLTCVADRIYNLRNNSTAQLEFESNPNLQLTAVSKSFAISNSAPPLSFLQANTSSGAVQFKETGNIDKSYKWFFHDLDSLLASS